MHSKLPSPSFTCVFTVFPRRAVYKSMSPILFYLPRFLIWEPERHCSTCQLPALLGNDQVCSTAHSLQKVPRWQNTAFHRGSEASASWEKQAVSVCGRFHTTAPHTLLGSILLTNRDSSFAISGICGRVNIGSKSFLLSFSVSILHLLLLPSQDMSDAPHA